MGSNRLISEEDKSKVEHTSLTEIFEEQCPIYMGYGMSFDEFWYDTPYKTKFYREAYRIQMKRKDEEFWMQGMYIYEALCDVSPILHAFSKSGTKPLPYRDKPFMYDAEKEMTEEEKEKIVENERLIAKIHFEQWAKMVAKRFENENK